MTRPSAGTLLTIVVVLAAVGAGIWLVGPPSDARERRRDERRIQALAGITRAANAYAAAERRLPADLDVLQRQFGATIVDPWTNEPFGYRILDEGRYELCATFSRPSSPDAAPSRWWHGAGRQCFTIPLDEET